MINKKVLNFNFFFFAFFGIVLITVGLSYAFFSYTKEGIKENSLTTGEITFIYNEDSNSFTITDALPKSDSLGLNQFDSQSTRFNFSVVSKTPTTATIDYVVTARSDISEIKASSVKMALTATKTNYTDLVNGVRPTLENLPALNSNTVDENYRNIVTNIQTSANEVEKVLFIGTVPANSNYRNDFVFTMWLAGEDDLNASSLDYSPYEFILKSSINGNNPINADSAIENHALITSKEYYSLTTGRDNYERVGAVNNTTREVYGISQLNNIVISGNIKTAEQFYQYNGRTFKTTINVYSEGNVSISNNNTSTTNNGSCPGEGCRYLFTTNTYNYGKNGSVLNASDTKANYNDVMNESGKNSFLGVVLSDYDHGKILKAYSCGLFQSELFCIEGRTDDSKYVSNKELLYSIYGVFKDFGIGCYDSSVGTIHEDEIITCSGNNNNVHSETYKTGEVYIFYPGEAPCFVKEDSTLYCLP